MTKGIITKGIGGFYYVKTETGIYESRARGNFREDKLTPLIGDIVDLRISEEDETGYILKIHDRKSQLVRPPVANVNKSLVVMSIKKPDVNTWLLDKFILMSEYEKLDIVIVINKIDLDMEKAKELEKIYLDAGYKVILTNTLEGIGKGKIKEELKDSITVLSGPSGAGKSSIINMINKDFNLEVGNVSEKTKRGKHTTRHVELLELEENSYVLDTPGFSSLKLDFLDSEVEVKNYFREIKDYGYECKFQSCLHDKEPGCNVKKLVEDGIIAESRYNNYLSLVEEVKNIRRY